MPFINIPKFYLAGRLLSDDEIAEHTRPLALCSNCGYVLCSCGNCHSIECRHTCAHETGHKRPEELRS